MLSRLIFVIILFSLCDVELVLPELVKTDDNGFKAVEYEKLTAFLIQVCKEQAQQINNQGDQINNQEDQINNQKEYIKIQGEQIADMRNQIADMNSRLLFLEQSMKKMRTT